MAELPTITDADALLAMLRENPTRRAVEYRDGPDDEVRPAIREYEADRFQAGATLR
jgi:hypothetical protein